MSTDPTFPRRRRVKTQVHPAHDDLRASSGGQRERMSQPGLASKTGVPFQFVQSVSDGFKRIRQRFLPEPPPIELEFQGDEPDLDGGNRTADEQAWHQLHEYSPVGYLTLDCEGRIVNSNRHAATLIGVVRDKLLGVPFSHFVVRDFQEACQHHIRSAHACDEIQAATLPLDTTTTARRVVRVSSVRCSGKSDRILMTLTDVSDLDDAQHSLRQLNEELAERVDARTSALHARSDQLAQHSSDLEKAIAALHHSESLFRAAFEDAALGMALQDAEGRYLIVNDAFASMVGYSDDELYGKLDAELTHPEDHAEGDSIDAQMRSGVRDTHLGLEKRYIHKSGAEIWALVSASMVRNGLGNPDFRIVHVQDISKRKRAEQCLRESEKRLDLAVRGSSSGLWDWRDVENDEAWWSPRVYELLGYEPGEIEPRFTTVEQLTHRDDRVFAQAALDAHITIGTPFDFEYRLRNKSGEYRWYRTRGRAHRDDQSGLLRMTGFLDDIHERKMMEAALRTAHEFNERIIDTAQQIVLVLNREGQIIRFNAYLEQLSGWESAEVQGQNWFDLFLRAEGQNAFRMLLTRAVQGLPPVRGSALVLLTKDGCEREIEWSVAMLSNAEGAPTELLCTGVDVTDKRMMEREILEIAETEQRRIGHDIHDGLCQELTGLGLLAQGLADQIADGEVGANTSAEPCWHAIAVQLSEGIGRTTRQARALSHSLVPVAVDAQGLDSALRELAATTNMCFQIHCELDATTPVAVLDNFVATHLYRIAQEAVNNAVKHSGSPRIRLALHQQGPNIVLRISDEGIGIPPSAVNGQSGMGLRTMHFRANLIGAMLEFTSGDQAGTTVTCTLPVR